MPRPTRDAAAAPWESLHLGALVAPLDGCHARQVQACRRSTGLLINAVLRGSIAYFLAEVLRAPDDPRFKGKAIPLRNAVIVGGLSLLVPAVYRGRRRWPRYPVWLDNLYLSIFWLDMAGNSFNLYNRFRHFDLLPHGHGTGALTVVCRATCNLPPWQAAGIATGIHLGLEVQEYLTDVVFGTGNVHGAWDSVGDVLAGLLGTTLYGGVDLALRTATERIGRSPAPTTSVP